jgi:hypothetical protein
MLLPPSKKVFLPERRKAGGDFQILKILFYFVDNLVAFIVDIYLTLGMEFGKFIHIEFRFQNYLGIYQLFDNRQFGIEIVEFQYLPVNFFVYRSVRW